MPRRPSVRYWKSRNAYCCWHNGVQHKLADGPDDFPNGPNYTAALKKFGEIVALDSVASVADRNTCRAVCEAYFAHVQGRRKERTLEIRHRFLDSFLNFTPPTGGPAFGEKAVGLLKPYHVEQWLAEKRKPRRIERAYRECGWKAGSLKMAIVSLCAVFNWGVRNGIITKNPIKGIERPKSRSRSRDFIVSADDHARILAAASPAVRDFIVCLEATGCRPGELAGATAADFDPAQGALIYHAERRRKEGEFSHKAAGREKDRIIFFTGEALDVVRRLVAQHPTGRLFRTPRGRHWTPENVEDHFQRLRNNLGLPKLNAYSYRHTFATRWLMEGGSIETLAEVMGNTPEVIRQHYAHLCGDRPALRQKVEAFRAAMESKRNQPGAGPDVLPFAAS